MKVELRYSGQAPQIEHDVERVSITFNDGRVFEFNRRKGGLYVRAAIPIHHALIILPMGSNGAVLHHMPEPE